MTLLVETCAGAVVVAEDLVRCLLRVTIDEVLELEPALDAEDTADVWTELGAEEVVELDATLEVDGTTELWMVLDAEDVLELDATLEVDTTGLWVLLDAADVLELDGTVAVVLETEDVLELMDELGTDDVEDAADEKLELDTVLMTELETGAVVAECELDD